MKKNSKKEKLAKQTPRRNACPTLSGYAQKKSKMSEKAMRNSELYRSEYMAANYRQFSLRIRPDSDLDIIAHLDDGEKVPNLTEYIKNLILADIYKDDAREKDSSGRPIEVARQFKELRAQGC